MEVSSVVDRMPIDDMLEPRGPIESPPLPISGDDRRMQIRAYNLWLSLLRGRQFPLSTELEPASQREFASNSVLLDFTRGPESPSIVFLGDALARECDLATGTRGLAAVPRGSLLSRLTDHYLQIIANRAPIGFEAEFQSARAQQTAYRGILMPFSSDNETIDFMFGVISWKDVASAEETMGISLELGVYPQASRRMPVWQDGTHANTIATCISGLRLEPAQRID